MEDNRIPHRVLHCYIIGMRSRGRQRKARMDNVKEDLRTHNIDIRDVTDLTRDRTLWRNLVQTHSQFIWWKRKKKKFELNWMCCEWFCNFGQMRSKVWGHHLTRYGHKRLRRAIIGCRRVLVCKFFCVCTMHLAKENFVVAGVWVVK